MLQESECLRRIIFLLSNNSQNQKKGLVHHEQGCLIRKKLLSGNQSTLTRGRNLRKPLSEVSRTSYLEREVAAISPSASENTSPFFFISK
jgi:hypothetical protein